MLVNIKILNYTRNIIFDDVIQAKTIKEALKIVLDKVDIEEGDKIIIDEVFYEN